MLIRRIVLLTALAVGVGTAPMSEASAQYYPPCSPFPLAWPFCVAGAIVGTAANIATAPIWLAAGAPPPLLLWILPGPALLPSVAYYPTPTCGLLRAKIGPTAMSGDAQP